MKRRELIKSLALTTLGGGVCLFSTHQAAAALPKPIGKALAIGQSLRFDDGLKLTLVRVRQDSRCPSLCDTDGDAEVVLLAYVGKQRAKIIRIHTHREPLMVILSALPPGQIGIPKTYMIRVESLTPPRTIRQLTIKQSDYRVVLGVEVAV